VTKNRTVGQRFVRWLQDFGRIRAIMMTVFLLIALLGWYMDFRYDQETAYLFCDCGWGRALAYGVMTIGPDLGYIVIGYLVIDFRLKEEGQRGQLIRQMGSQYPDVTDLSVRELARRGWLYNGTLDRADLARSNMAGADLSDASLAGVNLHAAKLSEANLRRARLAGANLTDADLSGARLDQANLSQAVLNGANLRGVDLTGANLNGVRLRGVDLTGVTGTTPDQLAMAATLAGATLPDGTTLRGDGAESGTTFEAWRGRQEGGDGV
jgi:hypothetical protein